MHVCVHVHVCMCVHICECACMCICVYMCAYMWACMYVYMCACVYMCIYLCVCICNVYMYIMWVHGEEHASDVQGSEAGVGVFFSNSPPYFFQTGFVTEPGA